MKCDIFLQNREVLLSCPSMWSSKVSDGKKKGSTTIYSLESFTNITQVLVLITRDPMARYRRSIWSQVCSSHTIQLIDELILGAFIQNICLSWTNFFFILFFKTSSMFRPTYQKLHPSVFALFFALVSLAALLMC